MRRAVVTAFVAGTVTGSLALSAPLAVAAEPSPNVPNATYYVGSNYSTGEPGGSCEDTDYGTITAALAAVVTGDTIVVCSGTYQEGALIVPSAVTELTIKGEVAPPLDNPSVFPAVGPQAGAPVLDGRDATTPGDDSLRVRILGAPDTFLHLENLTFQYGQSPSGQSTQGGGAVRAKRVTLDHMMFTENDATDGTTPGSGGAVIAVDPAPANTAVAPTMDIDSSSFTNNTAASSGGAVASFGYTIVNNSSFDGNTAGNITEGSAFGGAVYAFFSKTIVVTSSSFTNNSLVTNPSAVSGALSGTAISGGAITVTNSTVSKNTATGNFYFGPIDGSNTKIRFSTIVDNTASINSCGNCFGALFAFQSLTIGGSLVAGNTSDCVSGSDPNFSYLSPASYTDEGSNLSDLTGPCAPTGTSQAVANLAALKLGTLGAQGTSGTQSYPLQADSPALDVADCDLGGALAAALDVDQNGVVRPQGAGCDAGAVEYDPSSQPPPPAAASDPGVWIERGGNPVGDGACTDYPTITAALADAQNDDIIHVCPGLYVEDELDVTNLQNITFVGDGNVPDDVRIDGGGGPTGPNKHRVVNATGQTVNFENLVLQNGYLDGNASHLGGAAVIAEHVNFDHAIVRQNRVKQDSALGDNYGGAVSAATATITDSLFIDNAYRIPLVEYGATLGGAVYLSGTGASTITRSNFYANHTHPNESIRSVVQDTQGGAVFSTGPLTVVDSQFINNSASSGGAIAALDTLTVSGTTFDGNSTKDNGRGAAIYAEGATSITNSELVDGTLYGEAVGAAIYTSAALVVEGSTFAGSMSYNSPLAMATIYSTATGGAPDVAITNSTFANNVLTDEAVLHAAGSVELLYVTVAKNTNEHGGIILVAGGGPHRNQFAVRAEP